MMIDHDLVFDTITIKLGQTAQWRRGLARKYASDPRNHSAALKLHELSQADRDEIDGKTWDRLEPFFDSPDLPDLINEAARDVCFRQRPKDLNHLLVVIAEMAIERTGGVQ